VFKVEAISVNAATHQSNATVRYGVTNLPHVCAKTRRLYGLVRSHWGIESGLHYHRDAAFAEDRCRTRLENATHLNATLNNIALALLYRPQAPVWQPPDARPTMPSSAFSLKLTSHNRTWRREQNPRST
jgi:hypothetical protein